MFPSIHVQDAFATKLEHLAALRAGRNLYIRFAFQRWHRHFAAERRGRKRNWHFTIQIVFVALKDRMFLNVNDHIKVALRSTTNPGFAVARRTEPRTIGDPRRNFQFDPARFLQTSFAAAISTRFFHNLANAATARAGLRNLKKSAGAGHLTATAANRTIDRARSRLGTAPVALVANVQLSNFNFLFRTESRFFERDLH